MHLYLDPHQPHTHCDRRVWHLHCWHVERVRVAGHDDAVPLPLAPLVTVSQEVLLLTPVHAQPVGAVTVVEPVPPAAATD